VRVGRSWCPGVASHAPRSSLSWRFLFVRGSDSHPLVTLASSSFVIRFSVRVGRSWCPGVALHAPRTSLSWRFLFLFVRHLARLRSYLLQFCSGAFPSRESDSHPVVTWASSSFAIRFSVRVGRSWCFGVAMHAPRSSLSAFFIVGHLAIPSFQVVVFFTVVLWCVSLRDCPDVWMSVGCQLPTGAAIESIDDLVEVKLSSLRFFQCAHPPEGHIARI